MNILDYVSVRREMGATNEHLAEELNTTPEVVAAIRPPIIGRTQLVRIRKQATIIDMAQKGAQVSLIQQELGIRSPAIIYGLLKSVGIEIAHGMPLDVEQQIVEAYLDDTIQVRSILRAFGISTTKLYMVLDKYSVPRRR